MVKFKHSREIEYIPRTSINLPGVAMTILKNETNLCQ